MINNQRINEVLDGENNGIVVQVTYENNKKSFLAVATYDNNKKSLVPVDHHIRKFRNFDIAKLIATNIPDIKDIKYYISLGKNIMVDLDDCQKVNNSYTFFYNDNLYIAEECNLYKVVSTGYIIFRNGDSERCDKEEGFDRVKANMRNVKNACSDILYENIDISPTRIIRVDNNEFILTFKNTTGRIHIMKNSRIMDINQKRKQISQQGFGCIPYLKNMDKFETLYYICTKEDTEPDRIGTNKFLNSVIKSIVSNVVEFYDETARCKEINIGKLLHFVEE